MKILAFDIGGTKISYVLTDEKGNFLSEANKIKTPDSAEDILVILKKVIKNHIFDGIAVCTAGIVNNDRVISKPLNLPSGYENIDFKSLYECPVIVENDANAAAWCEFKKGAAKNSKNAIILAIGTGVGCGIICDNKILKGKNGAAGEVPFPISGKDFIKITKKYNLGEEDCFKVCEMVKKGDKHAIKVMEEWHYNLFNALITLNNMFDTEKIILTGSLAKIVNYNEVKQQVKNNCFGYPPEICNAEYENNAGLCGIALLWSDRYNT